MATYTIRLYAQSIDRKTGTHREYTVDAATYPAAQTAAVTIARRELGCGNVKILTTRKV